MLSWGYFIQTFILIYPSLSCFMNSFCSDSFIRDYYGHLVFYLLKFVICLHLILALKRKSKHIISFCEFISAWKSANKRCMNTLFFEEK